MSLCEDGKETWWHQPRGGNRGQGMVHLEKHQGEWATDLRLRPRLQRWTGHSLERVHAKGHIHAWAVGQEGSEGRLLKQAEDQDLIPGGTGEERLDLEHPHTRLPDPQTQRQTPRQEWTQMDQDTESPANNDAHTGERNRGSGI